MEQDTQGGMSRVKATVFHPAYKGIAQRWRDLFFGVLGMLIVALAIIAWQMKGIASLQIDLQAAQKAAAVVKP